MLARLWMYWTRVRDSLWFLPGVLTMLAALLAFAVTEAERAGMFAGALADSWIFQGGVEGARGVLNAIAGGLITVTGVVFSVTIVALQLASSQFTPRVLRNFTADRGNQLVLAVFIATFTYTLLVLRTVRSAVDGQEEFVPRLAVTLAVAFVLVSIGFLIYFIDHSARSIQVSSILERVTRRTLGDVGRLFPEQIGREDDADPPDPRRGDEDSAPVAAAESGYLQGVDGRTLFRLGSRRRLTIGMQPYIGDFVLPGQPLAHVSPPEVVDDEVVRAIRTACVLGPERTPEQDVEFGIMEISDIAIKALSPGINDPTTAFRCIDRLAEILVSIGTRRPPRDQRTEEGRVHYVARHTTFERAAGLAFDQIRHFGASNPAIVKKLLETLTRMEALVPPGGRAPLRAQADALLRSAGESIETSGDRAAVARADARLRG
jgi:uncharacterized membrane protein